MSTCCAGSAALLLSVRTCGARAVSVNTIVVSLILALSLVLSVSDRKSRLQEWTDRAMSISHWRMFKTSVIGNSLSRTKPPSTSNGTMLGWLVARRTIRG